MRQRADGGAAERSERVRKRVSSAVAGVAVQPRVSDSAIHSSPLFVRTVAFIQPLDVLCFCCRCATRRAAAAAADRSVSRPSLPWRLGSHGQRKVRCDRQDAKREGGRGEIRQCCVATRMRVGSETRQRVSPRRWRVASEATPTAAPSRQLHDISSWRQRMTWMEERNPQQVFLRPALPLPLGQRVRSSQAAQARMGRCAKSGGSDQRRSWLADIWES